MFSVPQIKIGISIVVCLRSDNPPPVAADRFEAERLIEKIDFEVRSTDEE